jgi:DNA-binding NarL/FixJ family response regulator
MEALSRLLEPAFEVVGTASDGDEAVQVALGVRPDLVLLDARMPRSSGFDAARRLRAELPATPFAFLTANRDPQLAAEAFRIGASAYILKDSTPAEFEAALRAALRARSRCRPASPAAIPVRCRHPRVRRGLPNGCPPASGTSSSASRPGCRGKRSRPSSASPRGPWRTTSTG